MTLPQHLVDSSVEKCDILLDIETAVIQTPPHLEQPALAVRITRDQDCLVTKARIDRLKAPCQG